MEEKIFELMTKMYNEMNERFNKVDQRFDKVDQRLSNVENGQKKIEIIIEHDIRPKIDALFDGYLQTTERLVRLEQNET